MEDKSITRLAKTVVDIIDNGTKPKPGPYDTQAQVVRTDGDTAYVHIPGGLDETPARKTIDAKAGDVVQVRVEGGSAYLIGNASAPPTDNTRADAAYAEAQVAWNHADSAKEAADAAWDYADQAEASAADALESAGRAEESAADALESAGRAEASAEEAKTQAIYATNYANGALTQLDTVESVVDTLNWITTHSTFVLTTDMSVVSGKTYYFPSKNVLEITADTTTKNGITFTVDHDAGTIKINGTATTNTSLIVGEPDIDGDAYLSGISGGSSTTYGLSYATAGASTWTYDGPTKFTYRESYNFVQIYVFNGATVTNKVVAPRVTVPDEDYDFEIVPNPSGNPRLKGYYELNIDDAVKTYVQSHLSLTNDGLYVLKDGSSWKVLVKNDGVEIQNETGNAVADYGASVRLGLTTLGHIILSSSGLEVKNGSDSLANFGSTVRIGKDANSTSRVEVTASGMQVIAKDSGGDDSTLMEINTSPYFTLGTRDSGAKGLYSFTVGEDNDATAVGSIAEGELADATGDYSHAEGYDTTAEGDYSHAEGSGSHAEGGYSHAEGCAHAVGDYSHAEGVDAVARGFESHAEGDGVTGQNASMAHAEGYGTADGSYSHAEGYDTDALGAYSHAEGYGTIAGGDNQTVVGKYNSNITTDLFEVGNGTDGSTGRANALRVTSANELIPGGQIKTSFKESVAPGCYHAAANTIPNLIAEVRYSSGCAGSFNLTSAYTANNITIGASSGGTWYNFAYIPHRSGGVNGTAPSGNDNVNYGTLLIWGMTADVGGMYMIRVASGSAQHLYAAGEYLEKPTSTGVGTMTWTVHKYADGTCEAYGTTPAVSCAVTTQWQNAWYVSKTQNLPSNLFKTVTYASVDRSVLNSGSGGELITTSVNGMASSNGYYTSITWYVINSKSGVTGSYAFSIMVKGTWK